MSYVIHIWESPVPASVADAVRFLELKASDCVGQNPKFVELAGNLTAAYPCITTLAPHDGTGVWSDGPLDGITDERCYVLGIAQHHGEVRKYIVSCAGRLGLTCFDMQEGLLFLPDGSILPEGTVLPETPPRRLSEADLEREFERIVRHAGFRPEARSANKMSREVQGCKQTIWLITLNRYGQYQLELRVVLDWKDHPVSLEFEPEFFHDGPATFTAWDTADAESAMSHPKQFILDIVLPFLDECASLDGLDRFLNDPMRSFAGLTGEWLATYLGALYAARTVDNERFDELVHAYSVRVRGYFREFAWLAMQRWVALLRQGKAPAGLAPDALFEDTKRELQEFIEAYTGARLADIEFAPNGRRGIGFMDRNQGYRRAVTAPVLRQLASAPIPLLADLLVAEAKWARGQLCVDRCVAPLAQALLARTGAASLDAIGVALGCGTSVLAAIKTVEVSEDQAAVLGPACRQRAHAVSSAKMKVRWLDLAEFFEQPSMQATPVDIAAFASGYASSKSHHIGFKWDGKIYAHDKRDGLDLNQNFREKVCKYVLERPDVVPLALVCDLFVAESHHARCIGTFLKSGPRTPVAMLLAQAMLGRAGLRELELFEMVKIDALDFRWPYDRMVLPGAKGPALADMCLKRSALAACPERKYTYLRLAQFLGQIPSEVPPGHLYNHDWRPKASV